MTCKTLVVFGCLLVAMVVADEKYTNKYDNLNMQEIVHNKRLLEAYVKCLLGEVNCTPEGKELKDHIQDALETGCSKCTDHQLSSTKFMIKHLIEKKPKYWTALTDKYDSKGEWKIKYEEEARKEGIKLP